MFEIEKDFDANQEKLEKLLKEAEFVGEKTFVDVYYDNDSYSLTSKNTWLRNRNGSFEIKVPLNGLTNTDRYEEIEEEKKIKITLGFKDEGNLAEALVKNGYKPFLTLTTHRKKYKKNLFNIDVDQATSDDGYLFEGMEIEVMVEDESRAEEAAQKILEFANQYQLEQSWRGKISGYIRSKRPDHFKVLSNLGIFKK